MDQLIGDMARSEMFTDITPSSKISGRTVATTTTMYRHENGRTYHAYRDGEYWQPNDAQQNNHEGIV